MDAIMADEKTGKDVSNTPNSVTPTDAPLKQSGASLPSPEHPPVSHIMPHMEIVPTGPVVVPPKPPTSNLMPPTPETKIVLTTPPPPTFGEAPVPVADGPSVLSVPTVPPSVAPPIAPAPVAPPVPPAPSTMIPPKAPAPSGDSIADDVGLSIPAPRSNPPNQMQSDMDKILKSIKLPEKRAYTPDGERKPAPSAPTPSEANAQKLDEILSAHITENTPAPAGDAPINPPLSAPSTVPDQAMFHEDMHVASVHTLKQDLQHVVQEQKMSVVKAVALEQEKRTRIQQMEPVIPHAPSKAPAIIFTIVLFLALGAAALGGVYYVAVIQSAPSAPVENSSLVFAEQTVAFPLTQDSPQSIRVQLAQARNAGGTLGSLLHVIPTVPSTDAAGAPSQRPATLPEFFTAIGAEAPENLMRALGNDFFLGIHTVDKNAPILVIKVTSYDRAFDGMLSWEQTLNGDLQPLFTPVPHLVMGADGLQTERPFTDLVMRNYDVRALKDDQGVIQLYYSFPTRDLLIIAESPYTFTEILSRLQAGRRL